MYLKVSKGVSFHISSTTHVTTNQTDPQTLVRTTRKTRVVRRRFRCLCEPVWRHEIEQYIGQSQWSTWFKGVCLYFTCKLDSSCLPNAQGRQCERNGCIARWEFRLPIRPSVPDKQDRLEVLLNLWNAPRKCNICHNRKSWFEWRFSNREQEDKLHFVP